MRAEPLQIRYVREGVQKPVHDPSAPIFAQPDALADACRLAGLTKEQCRSKDRKWAISHKRFHVFYLLREWGRSYLMIAKMTNHDHTSAVHGVKRWKEMNDA